jgi:ubiquinone/menaquinone biosynthesis C-methylase UbiE
MEVDSQFTVNDQLIMAEAKNYFRWQHDLVAPFLGSRVLEVGCGIGNFTELLRSKAENILALDIDEQCVAKHKQRFVKLPAVQTMRLDAMSAEIENVRFFRPDTVVCLNVLEHIEDDVQALRHMFNVLSPQGKVCLIVPAFEALRGTIDNRLGHYRRYTRKGLGLVGHRVGFNVVTLKYMNLAGFFGWWLNAKIYNREEQSLGQVKIFDRLIVPILAKIERAVAPPFGQNVFAVLEKP